MLPVALNAQINCASSLPRRLPRLLRQTDFEKDVDLACQTGELSLLPDFAFPPSPFVSILFAVPLSHTGLALQAVSFLACCRMC